MVDDGYRSALPDPDEEETEEWRESILSVEEIWGLRGPDIYCKKP